MKKILCLVVLMLGCNLAKDSTLESMASNIPNTGSPSVVVGNFCCDGWGNRRCQLNAWFPVGSSCFCYGQGNGYVCE